MIEDAIAGPLRTQTEEQDCRTVRPRINKHTSSGRLVRIAAHLFTLCRVRLVAGRGHCKRRAAAADARTGHFIGSTRLVARISL